MNQSVRLGVLLLTLALAATPQTKSWRGTWSATAGNGGQAFGGTWDATLADDPDTVQGNWTMMDHNGATLAEGTWAARKDAKTWRGSWQARTASGKIFSGTWRAQSSLPATAHMSDMFELSLKQAVSGTWQMGTSHSGAWSIRAYPRE